MNFLKTPHKDKNILRPGATKLQEKHQFEPRDKVLYRKRPTIGKQYRMRPEVRTWDN